MRQIQREYRWQDWAACGSLPSELFFPVKGGGTAIGRKICSACPVRLECLVHALRNNEQEGIWGGLNLKDRRRVKFNRWKKGGYCPLCHGALTLEDVAALALGKVEPRRWCCSECRERQVRAVAS